MFGPGHAVAQRPLGIDVSSFQDVIIWTNVQASGITFTWAKATEGLTVNDADFTYNEAQAKSAGVVVGAYHFAHPELHLGTAGADAEAAHFWGIVSNYVISDGLSFMPVLDYETAPGGSYTKATSSQWVNEWCQDIVNYGASNGVIINPIVYTYTSFATTWLNSSATNWPLWMAGSLNGQTAQTGAPPTAPWSTWAFWQYGQGTNPGITNGDVDLDVFNGTAATLTNFVVKTSGALTTTTVNFSNPATYGQTIVLTASVAPTPSGGIAQFYDNGVALFGPLVIKGGPSSYLTSFLAAGNHPITVSYNGALGYGASSTTNASILQINPAPLIITPSPRTKIYGTPLTFASNSTQFASSGLQNGETVGTVTLTDTGNGGAINAPVGTYAITPSLLTGGTFNPSNYNIIYNPGTLTVTLPSNTIPVHIVSAKLLGNRTVQLNFTGTPGYVYLIEAATNLHRPISWTILSTNAADTNGLFNFIDVNATNYGGRFYRTAIQQ